MKSGSKTDNQFDTLNYSLFAATWTQLGRKIIEEHGLTMTDLRLMTAIDALKQLYSWSLNGTGISMRQISVITGFSVYKITGNMRRLLDKRLISETVEQYSAKKVIRRYKLTKTGKTMINRISGDIDKVHERIIDYLYEKKLLK